MINLNDYFDRTIVLNLDIRPERWEQFQERAAKAGVTGFVRVRAIEGEVCPPPHWWRSGSGAWGCLMSHLRVAQDALLDGLDSYLVFEDDVVFSEDFADRLPKVMKQLETVEWDQLYLGGQHLYREASPPWPFRDGLVRCINVNRTHAMALHRRFMPKFIQHVMHAPDYIESSIDLHIDHQLGLLHQRRENLILATNPWLCGQAACRSDILCQEKEEMWWNDLGWHQ